jgi:hypothetical protein
MQAKITKKQKKTPETKKVVPCLSFLFDTLCKPARVHQQSLTFVVRVLQRLDPSRYTCLVAEVNRPNKLHWMRIQ